MSKRLLHATVVRALIKYCKHPRTHLKEKGQGVEGTRNHANCTTVEGIACVTLQREDAGGRGSMKTAGKYVKICGVEKTYSAW